MQLPQNHIAQGTYTDLNRLHRLKVGEERDGEANLRQVAQEFESLFISEMMKAMRSANDVLADDLFNSNESKTYRDMYDQQMAVTLAQGKGMGMADMLVQQMSSLQQGKARPNPFALADGSGQGAAVLGADKTVGGVTETPAAVPDSGKVQAEPAAAGAAGKGKPEYVHVADTTDIKFRRFTGITQRILANRMQNSEETGASRAAASGSDKGKHVQQQAARSYAAVKNTWTPPLAGKDSFANPEEFVSAMLPMAEQAARRLGVDPKYLVAQAALETGWGKRMQRGADGSSSYNLFGIKSHGWKGQSASARTSEFLNGRQVSLTDSFRKYDSFAHSFNDYVDFLQQNPRYQKALQAAGNAEQYVRELQRAGYATDPDYAAKISRIARQISQQPQMLARASGIVERT